MILRFVVFLSILSLTAANARGQDNRARSPELARVQQLYNSENISGVLALLPAPDNYSAPLELYRGLALARLGKWREARDAFRAGRAKDPRNPRFAEELAGAEYELKDLRAAKNNLHRALALSPGDEYAHDFLGTIYFLEGNLDAALANWNRIGKPQIAAMGMQPQPHLKNILLERAFAIAPLGVLKLNELRDTRARLGNLGIFTTDSFELAPDTAATPQSSGISGSGSLRSYTKGKTGGNSSSTNTGDEPAQAFTLEFHSMERDLWRSRPLYSAISALRGLPFLAIHPEFYNLGNEARNFVSLFRWDDNKRRVFISFSEPLDADPRWRLTLAADARNENWNLTQTFHAPNAPSSPNATAGAGINMEMVEFAPELRRVQSWRWSWQTGPAISYRRFRDAGEIFGSEAPFFTNSAAAEYRARSDFRILDLPERRMTLDSFARGSFGKNFAHGLGGYASLRGGIHLRWFPRATGEDYETNFELRAGKWFGSATLDELYQLGIERDNDLWLYGTAGTRDGQKGNAPLGREFVLANWETDKKIYDNGLIDVRMGPLFDAGRIGDSSKAFGSNGWLWDAGAALKLRVLGIVGVQLSYAYDFPTGQHAFYAAPFR